MAAPVPSMRQSVTVGGMVAISRRVGWTALAGWVVACAHAPAPVTPTPPAPTVSRPEACPARGSARTAAPAPRAPFAGKVRTVPPPRDYHTSGAALEIAPGRVLLVGGGAPDAHAAVELLDVGGAPAQARAPMREPRRSHTATRLLDGRVLVVGGARSNGLMGDRRPGLSSAEIYDPRADRWTPAAPMAEVRWEHTAALLPDGRVLVAGGQDEIDRAHGSVEIYDPSRDAWRPGARLETGRARHAMVTLRDGRLLVIGGYTHGAGDGFRSTEVYDPGCDTWTRGPDLARGASRTPVLAMRDGSVLVLGASVAPRVVAPGDALDVTVVGELLRADAGAWRDIGRLERGPGWIGPEAAALGDGRALRCGVEQFFGGPNLESRCHVYDPATERWAELARIPGQVHGPTLSLAAGGAIVLASSTTGRLAYVFE
jgi:hypothetical protein